MSEVTKLSSQLHSSRRKFAMGRISCRFFHECQENSRTFVGAFISCYHRQGFREPRFQSRVVTATDTISR